MKKYLVLVLICLGTGVFAQQKAVVKERRTSRTVATDQIAQFIDSLQAVIISDTAKFDVKQLYKDHGVIKNKKGYSKLFVIDNKYSYRLDMIDGPKVMEFVKEFFIPASIETIVEFFEPGATAIYGSRADLGAVYIQMKKGVKYNPRVGGIGAKAKPGNL